MAFFPCIRFENQIMLSFRGQMHGMENWTVKQKLENDIRLMSELNRNYELVSKLFIICADRRLRLVMENPYSEQHFLRRYWCIIPAIIDMDRRSRGDYFKKPTQFWFMNCEPKNNVIFEPLDYVGDVPKDAIRTMNKDFAERIGAKTVKAAKSMIHPQYARRFIREFLLDADGSL